jgi:hypothetical protein
MARACAGFSYQGEAHYSVPAQHRREFFLRPEWRARRPKAAGSRLARESLRLDPLQPMMAGADGRPRHLVQPR